MFRHSHPVILKAGASAGNGAESTTIPRYECINLIETWRESGVTLRPVSAISPRHQAGFSETASPLTSKELNGRRYDAAQFPEENSGGICGTSTNNKSCTTIADVGQSVGLGNTRSHTVTITSASDNGRHIAPDRAEERSPQLAGPFCARHTEGSLWDAAVHGVYLATESDCRSAGRYAYDHDSYWMAHACRSHGIATGLCVPQKAWLAIEKAYQHLAEPTVAAAWWSIARTILADAQARYGSAS